MREGFSGLLPPASLGRPRVPPARGRLFFLQRDPSPSRTGRRGSRFARRPPSRRRREAGRGRGRGASHAASGEVSHALHLSSRSRLCRFSQVPEVCIVSAAARVAAALGARAEEVCRRYLPQGRKQGRYWTAGDVYGARGRSLFVRLAPPGVPGKWTDASSGEHGDLLDLIRISSGAGSLRAAPRRGARLSRVAAHAVVRRSRRLRPHRGGPAACGGAAAPSTAPKPRPTSRPAALSAAASRPCASILAFSTATTAACAACLPWSRPSLAPMKPSAACCERGCTRPGPPRRM